MSFPRYPRYKDSEREWLGEVPEHWELKALRHIAAVRKGRLPSLASPITDELSELPYLSMAYLRGETSEPSVVPADPSLVHASDGDVLILWDGANAGEFLRAKYGAVSSTMAVLEPRQVDRDYLFFVCKALEQLVRDHTVGMGIPHVSGPALLSSVVVLPPPREQRAIVTFLTLEVARIDALIAEQQRLIELLKEKRQVVISQAVTKGLNPDVQMKSTGIEWLGDVPAGWSLERLESICTFIPGKAHEPLFSDDGEHLCVTSRFVSTGGAQVRLCTSNLCPAARGDTVMVMSDLPKGRALAKAYFIADSRSYAVNQRVCILRPHTIVPRFLYYLVDRTPELLQHDDGANQTHLSNADILKPRFPVPPLEEQAAIVRYLDDADVRFGDLLSDVQAAMALLEQRRAALISAAVTGKIDVRGLVDVADAA